MNVAILSGSIRIGRQSHKIAYFLERKLQERGITTDLIDLIDYPLPLLEERVNLHPDPPPATVELSRRLHGADAILFVSPEYHGSYSGVLKNAVDYFRIEFRKKPIGVVTATAGKMGGINAANLMQQLVLHMGAFALPLKLLIPEIQTQLDDNYQPLNGTIEKTVDHYLDEFLWFAGAIVSAKLTDLKRQVA